MNLFMFECTFRTGSSCAVDGEAAQSVQLIPLSCDLECDTADKGFIPLSCIPCQ